MNSQSRTFPIDIPQAFAIDHTERDLPSGECVKQTAKLWSFVCTASELREWRSDANHFSDCAGQGWDIGPGAIGLQSSARATVARIDRLMRSEGIAHQGPVAA